MGPADTEEVGVEKPRQPVKLSPEKLPGLAFPPPTQPICGDTTRVDPQEDSRGTLTATGLTPPAMSAEERRLKISGAGLPGRAVGFLGAH